MEYDYTNNHAFVATCEKSVTVAQAIPELASLKIYPNPNYGKLNVSVNIDRLAEFQIYNSLGVEVYSEKTIGNKSWQVEIANLIDGLYILQVQLEDGRRIAGKFMKLSP